MYESPIQVTATLVAVRKPGVFDAKLPNGKITCAHLAKSLSPEVGSFAAGDQVTLEMTPFDFDSARIAGRIGQTPKK